MTSDSFASAFDYFVDEAGDMTLFNKKGQVVVGTEGVSECFMVGVALVTNPREAEKRLQTLRDELLLDPYFKGVPSMQPGARKTALLFHACKDLPEVRREVFKILAALEAKVQVVVRRKRRLAVQAKELFQRTGAKISPNEIYDDLVKRLFRNLLHKAEQNNIIIARRGRHDRLEAIEQAIEKARRNFTRKYGIQSQSLISITAAHSHEYAGLQIIDYYLWALQRLFERKEDRFFDLLRPNYRLVVDLDDDRISPYGRYYSDSDPLELHKLKSETG